MELDTRKSHIIISSSYFCWQCFEYYRIRSTYTQFNSFAPIEPTDNGVWQSVDLFFGNNLDGTRFLDIKIDGTFIGTSYIGSFTAGGNYFGVGAWTGTATNNHWMRRFLIESALGHPR
jgi:hypothetical protein